MKLSEISTDRGMDIIAEAVPAIDRMVASEAVKEFYKKYAKLKLTKALAVKASIELIPGLVKSNREDVLIIISACTGKTLATVKAQPFMQSFGELKEMFSDPEFLQLFKSSVNTEPGASSVSSPEAAEQSDVTE
jgi:hypothetical protein